MRKDKSYPSWLTKKQLLALYRRRVTVFYRELGEYKTTVKYLLSLIDDQRTKEKLKCK